MTLAGNPFRYDNAPPAAAQLPGRILQEKKLLSIAQTVAEALQKYKGKVKTGLGDIVYCARSVLDTYVV